MSSASKLPPLSARISQFTGLVGRLVTPAPVRRALGLRVLDALGPALEPRVQERLDYYNRVRAPFEVGPDADALPLRRMSKQSRYWFDLAESLRCLPRGLRLDYRFGDETEPPLRPTIVKARRIAEESGTSVLLKLNKQRHYRFVEDTQTIAQKRPQIVWRGKAHQAHRRQCVARWFDHPACDFGRTDVLPDVQRWSRGAMTIPQQLAFRYVLSLEGCDVATNLKWIFSSNSVCVMPRPTKETWFMEGRLEPGVHYLEVRPDLADLEEVLERANADVDGAARIARNANSWVDQFRDPVVEAGLGLLVLQRYFWLAGQLGEQQLAPALAALNATPRRPRAAHAEESLAR
jgi:hypothetical protein